MNMHCFPSLLWLRVANFEQELAKYYEIRAFPTSCSDCAADIRALKEQVTSTQCAQRNYVSTTVRR